MIVQGELTKQPSSPFIKDRFVNSERKTPTCSPSPLYKSPSANSFVESPIKSPISTPKKQKKYHVTDTTLDAPDILDLEPNEIISFNTENHLAVALGQHVYIWRDGDVEYYMNAAVNINSLCWYDSDTLVIAPKGHVELWSVLTKRCIRKLQHHKGRVNCIACTNGKIATAGTDNVINLSDLKTFKTDTLIGHKSEIVSLSWSPDGNILASADKSGLLSIWANKKRKKIPMHFPIASITWITQTIIAVGGSDQDGTLKLVNILCPDDEQSIFVETGQPISHIHWCLARGIFVAHRILPFDVELFGRDLTKIDDFKGHEGPVMQVISTLDGSYAASIAADEKIKLWNFVNEASLVRAQSAQFFPTIR
ncbi:hypothetical protein TVAG_356520 [Trichomonas vaginalis G3]|uniref:Anaphase-promoting complex subunit 4 WD40 domain-containing protein n=1 Tax=Trichomonas vaginalis (strain ATCC PRA-98 / G3) TaxID=412133 RepID=A2FM71_TRIV3|nr:cell division cycle [Trichomonas vaginalis G3]EAX94005.1 hypothetical protein TVAG_356520 [Trichomonas vaginalis G3]KAI5547372.1 cell division cycle [Trichomonas vaginalis G3]|eukprot:XP_001306935.1 hypothetical protein [Trichomonas vaginalis G3]